MLFSFEKLNYFLNVSCSLQVHLNNLEDTPCGSEVPKLVELAKEVKKANIFLYGLIIHYQQVCTSMNKYTLYL